MNKLIPTSAAAVLALSSAGFADILHTDDVIISNGAAAGSRLCVGADCADGETFPGTPFDGVIKMSANNNIIDFNDTSGSSFPDRNWRIQANETSGGAVGEAFFIEDSTSGTRPFYIDGASPTHAVYIGSNGFVGLGTAIPGEELHVATNSNPNLRLEQFLNPYIWDVGGNHANFFIEDVTAGNFPFRIDPGAIDGALDLNANGNIGMGTTSPDGKLHTKGDGHQIVYFESSDSNAVQVRFRTDSQNRRFLATNNADQVQSQLIFLDSQVRITGPTDSGADLYAIFGPAGLVTRGPVCNPGPCDKVFDPAEFEVPTIEDHAAYMWENQHLWAVGPTSPDEPFNLTQKAGGMLHELEVAHIYIDQLHERLSDQESLNTVLNKRLDAMEAQLQVQ